MMVNGYSDKWLRQQFDWVDKEIIGIGMPIQQGHIVEIISQQTSLGVECTQVDSEQMLFVGFHSCVSWMQTLKVEFEKGASAKPNKCMETSTL